MITCHSLPSNQFNENGGCSWGKGKKKCCSFGDAIELESLLVLQLWNIILREQLANIVIVKILKTLLGCMSRG